MAYPRLISEDSNAKVGDETRQMDIISHLEGVPHILENIFLHLDIATAWETLMVSTTWNRLFTSTCSPSLWKCVWKKNVRMSPTWRALSARMEHFQSQLWDRMKEGDCSSYQEAYRYVQGNVQQISQSAMKNFNFQVLSTDTDCEVIRMNEKYVFFGGKNKVVIFHRWTRERVKEFVGTALDNVDDMQSNERFLVVHFGHRFDVYDAQKLVLIQTLEPRRAIRSDIAELVLGSDFLVICVRSLLWGTFMFDVHRWNPSAARFVRDTDTEDRLKVASHVHRYTLRQIYVDDQFLIVDFAKNAIVRLIQVYSLETMQLVRERQFDDVVFKFSLKREYHDGGIVVETRSAGGQRCLALWDVVKDTIQPMADHPSQFEHSFAMSHHPFQIVMTKGENSQQLLLVQRGQPTRNGVFALPSRNCVQTPYFHSISEIFYCDGLQMLALSYQSCSKTDRRNEIVIRIADMLG